MVLFVWLMYFRCKLKDVFSRCSTMKLNISRVLIVTDAKRVQPVNVPRKPWYIFVLFHDSVMLLCSRLIVVVSLSVCKQTITSLPKMLIVHLKRFQYDDGQPVRINTVINFPINGLDLLDILTYDVRKSETSSSHSQYGIVAQYDLFAMANHIGDAGGGHCMSISIVGVNCASVSF